MIVLQPKDAGRLVALDTMTGAAAHLLSVELAAIDPWARYPYPASGLEAYLKGNEAGAPRYVIRADGAIAGALGIRENWLRGPYLQFLGILPEFQNHGLGRLALAWFEGSARARSERNLFVAASDFNSAAIRFYERHGFVRAALLDGLVRDDKCEILLRKRLAIQK
jgi:ribosomal protein S18 acetylase RimI-like enzyme